jgi:hypothetical protein
MPIKMENLIPHDIKMDDQRPQKGAPKGYTIRDYLCIELKYDLHVPSSKPVYRFLRGEQYMEENPLALLFRKESISREKSFRIPG